jgi:hypothetical protein
MSSLEISLLLLAVAAIAAVAAYNLWLGRSRPARGKPAAAAEPAVGAGAARSEPSLRLDGGADAADLPAGGSSPPAVRVPQAVLDARTDCIVELALPSLVAGERLAALASGFRRAGGKPVVIEAARSSLPAPPDEDLPAEGAAGPVAPALPPAAPCWEAPVPGAHFDLVRVGVLLANRNGPLNAMEFSDFVAGVQALAGQLAVLAETPEMGPVLARARELDEVCASLDAQLGIGVESPEPLGVADLARLAGEAGCVERGNNRHARLGPQGEVLFSLALADAPNRLSLLLDVPRAPAEQNPWPEMVACARLCAQRLGGRLVDEAGRPLADGELDGIGRQVAVRQERLALIGIDAGSPLALRLFN